MTKFNFCVIFPRGREAAKRERGKMGNHKWAIVSLNERAGKALYEHLKAWCSFNGKIFFLDEPESSKFVEILSSELGGLLHFTLMDGQKIDHAVIELKSEGGKTDVYAFWAGMSAEEFDQHFGIFLKKLQEKFRQEKLQGDSIEADRD